MRAAAIALLAFALLAPMGLAQDHAHGGKAHLVILHDADPDGYVAVGMPTHVGFLVLGDDGTPRRHQDARLVIEQNGVVLFDSASLHDYDGVVGVDYTFAQPGPFTVTGEATVGGETLNVTFEGGAVEPERVDAALDLEGPTTVAAGEAATFTYAITGPDGALLPHTDAILEVRRILDGQLVQRIHTHTHTSPMEATLGLAEPGTYAVSILAYNAFPRPDVVQFTPFVTTTTLEVTPGLPIGADATGDARADAASNHHDHGGGDLMLFGTYDPQQEVSTHTAMKASVTMYNMTADAAVQHVNFDARILDPTGRVVFESATLHEYDGVLELLTTNSVPGNYTAEVTASRGDWSDTITLEWRVLPPAVPVGGGYTEVTLMGADDLKAGVPADLSFYAGTAAAPFAHGELDVQVLPTLENPPLVATKLHTHMSGEFAMTVNFPAPGEYLVRVDPSPTLQSGGISTTQRGDLAARVIPVTVAEGPGIPLPDVVPDLEDAATDDLNLAPGAPLVALLTAAGAVALTRRR